LGQLRYYPAAVLVLFSLLLAQSPAVPPGLIWRGAGVHPGCIRELTTDLADSRPVIAAVDLEGCMKSNRVADAPDVDGRVLRWKQPDAGDRGFFQYEYLGALSNGILVVRTAESGGGSGIFQELLLLRITPSTVLEDGAKRMRDALTMVGTESLGDRDRVTIMVSGDSVTIKRQEFRGAQGYGPEVTTVRRVQ
jgi:hypothetical protein